MSNLSPRAERLVRAVQEAYRPSDVDRARVLRAMQTRLGEAVLPSDVSLQPPGAPRWFNPKGTGLTMVGIAVVAGGGLWFTLHSEPARPVTQPRVTNSVPDTVTLPKLAMPEVTAAPQPMPAQVAGTALPSSSTRPTAARRPRDGLSEEVAMLSRAATDLNGGRPENALKVLDEHERKFGNGLLAEERTAARIQVLCALGRTAEAKTELERLAQRSPRSPQVERARQACKGR